MAQDETPQNERDNITDSKGSQLFLKYKKEKLFTTRIKDQDSGAKMMQQFFHSDLIDYEETFVVGYLDNSNNLIGYYKASQGGITGTLVDNRKILSVALLCGAVGILVAHNHPSGSTIISKADINCTNKLKSACDTMDIKLLDHYIITSDPDNYNSFTHEGLL